MAERFRSIFQSLNRFLQRIFRKAFLSTRMGRWRHLNKLD